MNIPVASLKQFFGVKNSSIRMRIRDPESFRSGNKKFGSRINIPDPQSCSLNIISLHAYFHGIDNFSSSICISTFWICSNSLRSLLLSECWNTQEEDILLAFFVRTKNAPNNQLQRQYHGFLYLLPHHMEGGRVVSHLVRWFVGKSLFNGNSSDRIYNPSFRENKPKTGSKNLGTGFSF